MRSRFRVRTSAKAETGFPAGTASKAARMKILTRAGTSAEGGTPVAGIRGSAVSLRRQAMATERPVRPTHPIAWRGIAAYLAIAFGLAWTAEIWALSRGVRFASLTLGTTLLLASVMFTPAIAAFAVRRFITREGFADAGLRRGPWRPYLMTWLGVPILVAGIYALTLLLGLGHFDPDLGQLTARIHEAARGQPLPSL